MRRIDRSNQMLHRRNRGIAPLPCCTPLEYRKWLHRTPLLCRFRNYRRMNYSPSFEKTAGMDCQLVSGIGCRSILRLMHSRRSTSTNSLYFPHSLLIAMLPLDSPTLEKQSNRKDLRHPRMLKLRSRPNQFALSRRSLG